MKKQYIAQIEKDSTNPNIVRQIFTATRISVTEEEEAVYIQFAEEVDDTTIHSLFFCIPKDSSNSEEDNLYAEFNDQGNGMFGQQIGAIELTGKNLTLSPSMETVLCAGRVSYSLAVDPFEQDIHFSDTKINQVVVKHNTDLELLSRLDLLFQGFSKYGIVYHSNLEL